jgi:hypothetical protein
LLSTEQGELILKDIIPKINNEKLDLQIQTFLVATELYINMNHIFNMEKFIS